MEKFTRIKGIAAYLPAADIPAARILPADALHTLHRAGLGKFLFAGERYEPNGREKPDFILNKPAFRRAAILVAGRNFGHGAPPDHLFWSMIDFGFRTVIAAGFDADFEAGCFKHGILPVTLPEDEVQKLGAAAENKVLVTVDLDRQIVSTDDGYTAVFKTDPFRRHCLLAGLDDIGLTLEHEDAIHAFEKRQREELFWLFG